MNFLLISGVPRAGKTSLANVLESKLGITHIPMDKYILPVPEKASFIDWVRTPNCVDWPLIEEHLNLLMQGKICYSPQPNWNERGVRISEGGLASPLGKEMKPSLFGYSLPGTHSFAYPYPFKNSLKVFIDTPRQIIASRFISEPISKIELANSIIEEHIGDNHLCIEAQISNADLVISGESPPPKQIEAIQNHLASA